MTVLWMTGTLILPGPKPGSCYISLIPPLYVIVLVERHILVDQSFIIALIAGSAAGGALVAALITGLVCAGKIATQTRRADRAEDKLSALQDTDQRMREAFTNLSSAALQANNDHFLTLAQQRMQQQQEAVKSDLSALVNPLKTTLEQQQKNLHAIEQARTESYSQINTLIANLKEDQLRLQSETTNLVKALRQPQVRGRWGELQLRRVVELAGMSNYCDFDEQQTMRGDEGKRLRPDMQIHLPNQRQIVIDSKVPLEAYLKALEAADEETREAHLKAHARQVRSHVDIMHKREYQKHLDGAHDFVVLFIPGEVFYSAALEHDQELLDYAAAKSVILATPTTLIALLKAVAQGWREARLAEDARKVKEVGEQIYNDLNMLASHITNIGKGLDKAIGAYNKTIGSVESRLLVHARRLCELEISSQPITAPDELTEALRRFGKPELTQTDSNRGTSDWKCGED